MSTKIETNTILHTENSKLREKIVPILINTGIAIVSGLLVGLLVYLTYNYINKKGVPAGPQVNPKNPVGDQPTGQPTTKDAQDPEIEKVKREDASSI